ncbi:hypothetical protein GCM10027298_11560 [Epidermidibacterium keratini]
MGEVDDHLGAGGSQGVERVIGIDLCDQLEIVGVLDTGHDLLAHLAPRPDNCDLQRLSHVPTLFRGPTAPGGWLTKMDVSEGVTVIYAAGCPLSSIFGELCGPVRTP